MSIFDGHKIRKTRNMSKLFTLVFDIQTDLCLLEKLIPSTIISSNVISYSAFVLANVIFFYYKILKCVNGMSEGN